MRLFLSRPMIVDLNKPVVETADEKGCVYTCKEPGGSLIAGLAVAVIGILIAPVFLEILLGTYPLTIDGFLAGLFLSSSRAVGYDMPNPVANYVVFFAMSLIAGMVTMKPSKALALPFVVLAINIIAFFFLALFILGISISYADFFNGFFINLVPFALTIVVPSLSGCLIMRSLLSMKKCYIKGKGAVFKEN